MLEQELSSHGFPSITFEIGLKRPHIARKFAISLKSGFQTFLELFLLIFTTLKFKNFKNVVENHLYLLRNCHSTFMNLNLCC